MGERDRGEREKDKGGILILLGAPGAGKGTQAQRLARQLGWRHVSTGEILREAVAKGSALGRQVEAVMARGELVPDELVARIVHERLQADAGGGFILDGFPRNLAQARFLSGLIGARPVRVAHIRVSEEEVVKRLSGRRQCRLCGKIYNVYFSPPPREGECECGGELFQRPDDREEVIRERLRVYQEQTAPLVEYYSRQGAFFEVDGNQDVEAVARDLVRLVRAGDAPP